MTDASEITFVARSGLAITLSPDAYRLALLWLIDFEGAWEGLEAGAQFVPDGRAKLALFRARVRPLGEDLAPLGARVDAMALLAARHWFRHGPITDNCDAEVAP